ncbi:MAG: DUF4173 domain-containing protein [bacterium]|nr:DUF4173 domain-containing protein [bacterium]
MEEPTGAPAVSRRWPEVLAIALAVAIAGDVLLRPWPWGIGAVLWMTLVLAGLAAATRRAGIRQRDGAWFMALAAFFAGALAWRDAGFLRFLNVLALLVTLGFAVSRNGRVATAQAGVADLAGDLLRSGWAAASGCFSLLSDEAGRDLRRRATVLAGLRGLALAIPLLVVFGAVLVSADPVFSALVLGSNLPRAASHLLVVMLLAWGGAGALREALSGRPWILPAAVTARRPWLGAVEFGVILGLLDALFLAFVVVQFRYLFGGASLIAVVPHLTYAQYARRGFFELVAAVALTLGVLLLAHWLLRPGDRAAGRVYRALAGAMVGLVMVIVGSGFYRMGIYFAHFGLTPARLYATVFMAGLAATLVWFSATALRGRRASFAIGGLVAGLAVVVLLNFLNPDHLVTRVNVARSVAGHPVDAWHLMSLSADAVPGLVASLDALPERYRPMVAARLLGWWGRGAQPDWRTWNWGRAAARRVVQVNREALSRLAQDH